MATNVTIRELRRSDMDSVSGFFKEIDNERYKTNFYPHPFTELEARRVCCYQGRDQYVGVFLKEADEMVGYGLLRGLDEGYEIPSLGLCILHAYQGRGLGQMLMSYLVLACEKLGMKRVMLKVKRENAKARSLYEKANFVFEELEQPFLIGYRDLE